MLDKTQPRSTQSEYFSIIYNAARNNNKAAIEEALKEVSINLLDTKAQTPVERLIYENDFPAVNFLCENFNVSDSGLISGYALIGNVGRVRQILARTEDMHDRFVLLIYAIDGFARGEGVHPGLVEDYLFVLRSVPGVTVPLLELELAAFTGYTVAGNNSKAMQIYSKEENDANKNKFLAKRAYALALTCNDDEIKRMQDDNWYGLEGDLVPEFLYGLARGNHIDELEILIRRLGSLTDEQLRVMAGGFAISGLEHQITHIYHRVSLENRMDFLNHVVSEFIEGGFFGAAKRILLLDMIATERASVLELLITKFLTQERAYEYYAIYTLALDRESKKFIVNAIIDYFIEKNDLAHIKKLIEDFDNNFSSRIYSMEQNEGEDKKHEVVELIDPFFINQARKNLLRHYASKDLVEEINSLLNVLQTESEYSISVCYVFMGFFAVENYARIEEFIESVHADAMNVDRLDVQEVAKAERMKVSIFVKLIDAMFRMKVSSYLDRFFELEMTNEMRNYLKKSVLSTLNSIDDYAKIYQLLSQTSSDENQLDIFSHVLYLYGLGNKVDPIMKIIEVLPKTVKERLHVAVIYKFIDSKNYDAAVGYSQIHPLEEERRLVKRLIISELISRANTTIHMDIFSNFQIICEAIKKLSNGFCVVEELVGVMQDELFSSVNFSTEKTTLKTFFSIRSSDIYTYIYNSYIDYKNMSQEFSKIFSEKLKKLSYYEDVNIAKIDLSLDIFQIDRIIFYLVAYHFKIFGHLKVEQRADVAMMIIKWFLPTPFPDTNENRLVINKITADYFSPKITLGGTLNNFKFFSMNSGKSKLEIVDEYEQKSQAGLDTRNLLRNF